MKQTKFVVQVNTFIFAEHSNLTCFYAHRVLYVRVVIALVSIHNSPDAEFLVDQIQYGFNKMIAWGFFCILDQDDSINVQSKATWFMGEYIKMICTILHRAYICDMGGKHYHFAYAVQNYLLSKQADLEKTIHETDSGKAGDSASVDHSKLSTTNEECVIPLEQRELISFIQYYIQAFLIFQSDSDLQFVNNRYVNPSQKLINSLNCKYNGKEVEYGNKISDHYKDLQVVVARSLDKEKTVNDIDPPNNSPDRWLQFALSCYKSMR